MGSAPEHYKLLIGILESNELLSNHDHEGFHVMEIFRSSGSYLFQVPRIFGFPEIHLIKPSSLCQHLSAFSVSSS